MREIKFSSEYFNAADTLLCGQLFRFTPHKNGYLVFSRNKACFIATENGETKIACEDDDEAYFRYYFDLERDYSAVVSRAKTYGGMLLVAADAGKGIRILNQDSEEVLFSFVVSQNNNIPRIKGIIEKLCVSLGEEKKFDGIIYYTFPNAKKIAEQSLDFFYGIGLGYRAPFIKRLAESISAGELKLDLYRGLATPQLKIALKGIYGVGQKVADCVSLFGFHRSDAFPVDVWTDRVYREFFNGELKDREKISEWFVKEFGDDSGYFQQYLFYYKRTLENRR